MTESAPLYIDQETYRAQAFAKRTNPIDGIVIHYTACTTAKAVELLTGSDVSAHYLITDAKADPLFQLLPDSDMAWHAGESYWQGNTHLNETTIGIEVVYPGAFDTLGVRPYFKSFQIEKLIALLASLVEKHGIDPKRIVGHSDIAYWRKSDPGLMFPWHQLAKAGFGMVSKTGHGRITPDDLATSLHAIGYKLPESEDEERLALIAYQSHFCPESTLGVLDKATAASIAYMVAQSANNQQSEATPVVEQADEAK